MNNMALTSNNATMEKTVSEPASPAYKPGRSNHTVYVLDRHGRIIDTNESVAPLTGYGNEGLCGRRLGELLEEAVAASLEAALSDRSGEGPVEVETMLRCRDGRKRPVRGFRMGLRDEDGTCSGLMVYLEPSLLRLAPEPRGGVGEDEGLADLVSDAVIDVDGSWEVESINLAGRAMFGWGEGAEAEVALSSLFDPSESFGAPASLGSAADDRSHRVAVLRRADGKRLIGKVSVARRRGGGLRLVVQNLSRDREVERLGVALRSLSRPGGFSFAIVDEESKVVFVDPCFAAMCGRDRWEEMMGAPVGDLVRSHDDGGAPDGVAFNSSFNFGRCGSGPRWSRVSQVRVGRYTLVIATRP